MTCEQAEEYLSAYLDDMLELPAREEIATHLNGCDACRAELAELRRLDGVLAAATRVQPSDDLHHRIFDSTQFARLMRELDRSSQDHRAPQPLSPSRLASRRSAPPGWTGAAWRAAAVLALVLGSALLIKQGLFHSATPSGRDSTLTIGNPTSSTPLSAGIRAVYAHDGALWSAPESGPGIAQRLTPSTVRVAGWAVSPDGRLVAYIDALTGRIHVVRSDDQNDHALAAQAGPAGVIYWNSAAGASVCSALAWSPDGARIAYLSADGAGQTTLRLMNADGSNDLALNPNSGALTGAPVWSADSLRIAYTQASGGTQSVWSYSADTKSAVELAAQVDPAAAQATVGHLAWLPDGLHPTVTWSATDGGAVTGVFTRSILSSGPAERLTPSVTRFGAAEFSPAHEGGAWLVSGTSASPAVAVVDAQTGAMSVQGTRGAVREVAWSPDGATASYVTADGTLYVWTTGAAPEAAMSGVTGAPVWSSDGRHVVVQTSTGLYSIGLTSGSPEAPTRLGQVLDAAALAWAPDGREIAITRSSGVTFVSADGSQTKLVDARPADGSRIIWSVAG